MMLRWSVVSAVPNVADSDMLFMPVLSVPSSRPLVVASMAESITPLMEVR